MIWCVTWCVAWCAFSSSLLAQSAGILVSTPSSSTAASVHARPFRPPIIRPKVFLALSGGGARGLTQIGVLKVLEREGIPIDGIVGTSIGAIVGGLYASGYRASELDSLLTKLNWTEILGTISERERADEFFDQKAEGDRGIVSVRFKDGRFVPPEAVSGGFRLTSFLYNLVWNALYRARGSFDDLRVPFRAMTTDLVSGKSVAMRNGDLVVAMRASATFPLRFTPVKLGDMVLVDGGLLANVPVRAARNLASEIQQRTQTTRTTRSSPHFHQDYQDFVQDSVIVIAVDNTSPLLPREDLSAVWNIADQAASLMMRHLADEESARADILLRPLASSAFLNAHRNDDFTNLQALVSAGERAAEQSLAQIREQIRERSTSRSLSPTTAQDTQEVQGVQGRDGFSASALAMTALKSAAPPPIAMMNIMGISSSFQDSLRRITSSFCGQLASETVLENLRDSVVMWFRRQGNSMAQAEVRIVGSAVFPSTFSNSTTSTTTNFSPSENQNKPAPSTTKANEVATSEVGAIIEILCDEALVRSIDIASLGGNFLSRNRQLLIQKELPVNIGEPFNAERTLQAWRGLVATNFFNDISLLPTYNNERGYDSISGVNVSIRAEERPTLLLRAGARIDNERNVQGSLEAVDENVFYSGLRAGLRVAGGGRNVLAQAFLSAPRLFTSPWQLDLRGYAGRTNIYTYTENLTSPADFQKFRTGELGIDRFGFRAAVVQQIERNGSLSGEFRYEFQRIFDFAGGASALSTPFTQLNTLRVAARFDTQDRADFPSTGRTFDLSLEFPVINVAGGSGFSKAVFAYSGAFSFGWEQQQCLRGAVNFGFADKTMPATEFFSLGGEETFYGMREDEFRGTQIAMLSLEYRLRLPWKILGMDIYSSLRYNTGTTWAELALVKISDFRQGIGFSAALDTPFGPARISAGRSFYFVENPNGAVWGQTLFYFSVGIRM